MKFSIVLTAAAMASSATAAYLPDLFSRDVAAGFKMTSTGDKNKFGRSPDGVCHLVNADNCLSFCKCDKNGMSCNIPGLDKGCSKKMQTKICKDTHDGLGWKCCCEPK